MDALMPAYAASPLPFWVLASLLVYVLATNLLWLTRTRAFWQSPYSRWLLQAGRFFYFVGLPYLALGGWPRPPHAGLLSLEDLGLVGLDLQWTVTRWLGAAGTGLGIGLLTWLLLAVAWANANRSADGTRLRFAPRPWWALLVEGLLLQVHWAFYRGALAAGLQDLHAGVYLGLGLVYLEWGLNPAWRAGWRQEGQAAGRWLRAALALASALIYLLTRNLWICLAVHWLLELTFWHMGRLPEPAGRRPARQAAEGED